MAIPTQQYELSDWQGMDRWTPETEYNPHFWYDLQNMECDDGGVTAKRRGAKWCISFSGTCNMIYDHQDQINQLNRALIVCGSTLHVVNNLLDAATVSATFSTTDARHYAVTNDVGVSFISTENGGAIKMLCYHNSAWVFQDADLVAPAAITASTASTTTALTGTFSAIYTYVDAWGNESPGSPESSEVSLATTSLEVVVTASADPTVDHIAVYVLGPGMSEYQLSGTMSNTNGTFSHTIGMEDLMSGMLYDSTKVAMPQGRYVSMYEDMLLIAGDTTVPDTVWCSARQFHRQWNENFSRCVTGDGQPIKGFGDSFDRKLVYKADSIHLCDGTDPSTFRTSLYSRKYGATAQTAITSAIEAGCWWSDDGLYVDSGQSPQEVSRVILQYLRNMDYRNMVTMPPKVAVNSYKYYRQVYLALREYAIAAGPNDVLFVWNHLRNNWTKHVGNVPHTLGVIQNVDDYEFMYGGDVNGNIWYFSTPNSFWVNDDTTENNVQKVITCVAETPWMNFAKLKEMPDWERTRIIPRYLKVYASGQPASGSSTVSLDCGYYVDFDRDTCVNTFSVAFTAHDWPTVRPYENTIYYGGKVGTYKWVKWRFEHAVLGEHIRIHKLVWGFKTKPSMD